MIAPGVEDIQISTLEQNDVQRLRQRVVGEIGERQINGDRTTSEQVASSSVSEV